ncbi:MAG: hypothetical protein R3362_09080, partial [Rhodothermales bacterium]|nr:hypothetical protein [Rhodothermales bacterium]
QIKTRGYRVELDEVEAALVAHPAVEAAAAFPVPDGQGSQRIEAAVTVRDGAALTPDALRRHAAAYLPAYAVPAAVAVVDAFPETSTGKIDRLALQARAAARPSAVPSRP